MDEQNFSREVAFNQSVINIGSDSGNDIVLMGDTIADFHAMLYFDSDRWFISSLHDNYKTTVNGLVVDGSGIPLQNGSVVNIGDYRLTMMLNGMNTDIIIAGSAASYQPSGNEGSDGGNILLSITSAPSTEVEVGTTVEYELTVTNAGPLVANMQLQLQGVPSSWVQIIPPVLNLNEGRKGVFTVRISPPRDSSAKAGFYNLHFVAMSPNYQRETGIVDTGLTILPYSDFLLNGPTPRRLTLSRRTQTDSSDVVILNNSNSDSQFFLRSYDDANDLYFSYGRDGQEVQGQDTVTVSAGDNVRVPMRIGSRKLPLLGFTNKTYHYYTNVTPTDRPGDGQSVLGEVVVRPLINTFWLLFALSLLLFFALFLLQPRILQFEGADGKQTQVILSGNTAQIQWRVSNLTFIAGKLTLDDGSGEKTVSQTGSQLVSPTKSTTYTLTAENLFSRLLGIPHVRSVQVLIIPQRPVINAFAADHKSALAEQQVKLDWAVGDNAVSASILRNKQQMDLTPETYSGTVTQGYTSDTLFSVRALNDSGYEMKSLFLNVSPARINLNRFTVWVRPNGIAVPNNNDSRRTTRWSALQLNTDSTGPALIRPAVNPQPAPQSITLNIPDNFNNTGSSPQGMNPEQMMLSGQSDGVSGYVYQDPMTGPGSSDLLVSPSLLPTATPTAIPSTELITRQVISSTTVPATSPEAAPYNRDFSVKLVEVVEDPLAESGYRLIDYFPDYQLQKNEQILVEWNVDGVSQVKIENLSNDALNNTGGNFAYPEKSTTYVLEAQTGDLKKDYSLPVRVAGDADDGEGSGLKCDLKANAATLKVPGAVMLSWTGGGTNRVQLVSSSQAEKDNEEAQKKAEQEAKEKGQPYTKPTNAPLTGGTIGDWLQPSGFMRVNVEKQTTFVLNAYDGNGNVICTKSVDVKLEGGNDKKDISDVPGAKFAITRIADDNDVSQAYYTVGQTVHYTIAMTGFPKGQEPTGSVMITDGTSTCSVTLPVTTCAFQAKKAGNLTVTAVYSGDNVYSKATATAKETVIDKLPTTLEIQSAYKSAASLAELVSELKFDTKNAYGLIPTGTITFTVGSGTCDLDIISEKLSCDGKVTTPDDNGYKFTISKMLLADANADRVTAAYKGDDYFLPSTAKPVLFRKVNTETKILNPEKVDSNHADLETKLTWDDSLSYGMSPTGTITYTIIRPDPGRTESTCVLTLPSGGSKMSLNCDGTVKYNIDRYIIRDMLFEDPAADRVKAVYSGDFLFNKSESPIVVFGTHVLEDIPTDLTFIDVSKTSDDKINGEILLAWDKTIAAGAKPSGTIVFESGTGSCTLSVSDSKPAFTNCKAGSVTEKPYSSSNSVGYSFVIENLEMNGVGDAIQAKYTGYDRFQTSSTPLIDFILYGTQTVIEEAYMVNYMPTVKVSVAWDKGEAGSSTPEGSISFKLGADSCVLSYDEADAKKWKMTSCAGTDTEVSNVDYADGKITWTIRNILLSQDNEPDRVKAIYSGDSLFSPSSSTEFLFDTVPTVLAISGQHRTPSGKVDLTLDLSWFDNPPEVGLKPSGTIVLDSGNASCTLNLDADPVVFVNCNADKIRDKCEDVLDDSCGVDDKKLSFEIKGLDMGSAAGSTIQAEYSGDGTFLESESDEMDFGKLNTEIHIDKAYKTNPESAADVISFLTWDKEVTDGKKPTGTITLTIGSDVCKFDIAAKKLEGCTGENTKTDLEDAAEAELTPYGDENDAGYKSIFEKLMISSNTADRVKIEYSGDAVFNSSSRILLFKTVPTTLDIQGQKKNSDGSMALETILSWTDDSLDEYRPPMGTIKLTAGSASCTFDINSYPLTFTDCEGEITVPEPDTAPNTYKIQNMKIGDGTASEIKAEYSGDGLYLTSASEPKPFTKDDTQINVIKAYKSADIRANFESVLSWKKDTDKPTGVITYTIGSDSCKLTLDPIEDGEEITDPKRQTNFTCSDGTTKVLLYQDNNNKRYRLVFTDVLLTAGNTADRVKADYAGDVLFNPSSSEFFLFQTIPTTLDVTGESKVTGGLVNLTATLAWNEKPLSKNDPTGIMKLTMGSASCSLNIVGSEPVFTDCDGKAEKEIQEEDSPAGTFSKKWIFTITNLKLGDGSGDSIKAEYAGDGLYLASASEPKFFNKFDTEILVDKAYKSGEIRANFESLLSWKESVEKPTGVITYTIGSDSCKLTLDPFIEPIADDESIVEDDDGKYRKQQKNFTCSDADTKVWLYEDVNKQYRLVFTDVLLTAGSTADRVKAEYSGDGLFNASTSEFILFKTVPTETKIDRAYMGPGGEVHSLTVYVHWDKSLTSDSDKPGGTIKLTAGSASCTLEMNGNNSKFTDCVSGVIRYDPPTDVDTSKRYVRFIIPDLKIGDGTAASIKAEYSGDGYFLKSESDEYFFKKVDTTLTIDENSAYKPADSRVNLSSTLKWCKEKCGDDAGVPSSMMPLGTITYTMGSDICKLDLSNRSFTCKDDATKVTFDEVDEKKEQEEDVPPEDWKTYAYWNITFKNILLSNGNNPDRVKAEFSGDTLFNASSSDYVLFDTVPTTTTLVNQDKTPAGLINARVMLSWEKEPLAKDTPKGTIKLTSGSATCTLNLALTPVHFTDCSGSVTSTPADKELTYEISNLNMGSGAGEDIKAEYSGSGSYLPSASDKKSFTKVNTTLVIESAYKPNDPNYANLISVLSWNKEKAATRVPTGTIKFMAGSGSCELNLSTKKLSCRSASDPINIQAFDVDFDNAGYRVIIEKMLLADSSADRVTAEYSGDAVFNSSTASAKLFKKLDTAIDITNAYRDKTTGRASVYVRMDWDEAEDEGLKPTGSLKFNLGSGSCTMDLKTKKLSCVGDTMGTISADGHDYSASNLLLTDTDAKIVSVEYSGDGFFNSSVSQQKLFSKLKTTIAVTAASKGCDGDKHCFINLSGTLDWEEDVSVIDLPTGTLNIKVGNKTIKFDMDDQTFTGVVAAGADYTSIANQVGKGYDPTNRHTFEFDNLLLDDVVNENDITVEYSGDDYYGYSTGEKPISKITLDTRIDIDLYDYRDESVASHVWLLRGKVSSANYELPFDLNLTGSFTMKGNFNNGEDNKDFYTGNLQPGGGAYRVNNFDITLRWTNKELGRYELRVDSSMTVFSQSDLRWVSIQYNGDDSAKDSQLYNSSNTAHYYGSAKKELDLQFWNYVNGSETGPKLFMDSSGRKYFNLYVGEKTESASSTMPTNLDGTWTFVTDSGMCSVKTNSAEETYDRWDHFKFTQETGECSIADTTGSPFLLSYISSVYDVSHPRSMYVFALDLGSSSDTFLEVYFEGNSVYKKANIRQSIVLQPMSTSLSFESKEISYNKLNLSAKVNYTGTMPEVSGSNVTVGYPNGKFIIRAGEDYTCTVNIIDSYNDQASFGSDCGADVDSALTTSSDYHGIKVTVKNLPIPDPTVNAVEIEYLGDTIYKPSGPVTASFSRTSTTMTLIHNESDPNKIVTTIKPTSHSYLDSQQIGTVTYTFSPSGTTCVLEIGRNKKVTVKENECDGGSVPESDIYFDNGDGTLEFTLTKDNISQTDMEVKAAYSGDGKYSFSSGSTSLRRYNLTLIPVTEGLDSSGRLYFNTQNVTNVYYPKFPEQHISNAYQYCDSNYTSSECRLLKQKFTLSVRIDTDPYAPDLSGSKLQFSGDFSSDSSSNQCTITPDSPSGVYHCNLENVYFNTPGLKKISVSFSESDSFYSASADFPEMYAVSIGSDSKESRTAINSPASSVVINVGDTVTIEAEAFEYLKSDNKDTVATHYMIYAYDSVTNHRYDQSCNSNTCTLTIPSGANSIIAEYLGNDELRPSLASKSVGDSSTSSGNMTSSTNSMPRGLGVSITIENIQPITEGE